MRNSRLMRKISKVSFSTDPDQEFPLPPVSPTRQASTSSDVSFLFPQSPLKDKHQPAQTLAPIVISCILQKYKDRF